MNNKKLMDSNKEVVDSIMSVNGIFAETFQKVSSINAKAASALFEQSVANFKKVAEVKDFQGYLKQQETLVGSAVDQCETYYKEVLGVVVKSNDQVQNLVEKKLNVAKNEFDVALDKFVDSVPAEFGSGIAVSAVKTMTNSANNAMNICKQVAEKANNVAEQNVSLATQAVKDSIKSANSFEKKVA